MQIDVKTHDHGALFNVIDKQQRGHVVTEANDAARRQAAELRDARSVAAPDTKLQGSASRWHDQVKSAKDAGEKQSGNVDKSKSSVSSVACNLKSERESPLMPAG